MPSSNPRSESEAKALATRNFPAPASQEAEGGFARLGFLLLALGCILPLLPILSSKPFLAGALGIGIGVGAIVILALQVKARLKAEREGE